MGMAGEEEFRGRADVYRSIFEMATDAIFIHDRQGAILEINRAAHERLGYSREEMLAMNVADIDLPEFSARMPERVRKIMKEGPTVFESAHRRRDGTVMPVEINARVFHLDGEEIFFSIVRDISRRKAAEEKIRESENKFRVLFETANDGIFLHDLDGRIIDVNKKVVEMLDYGRGELMDLRVMDFHPPEAKALSREAFAAISREGSVSFEIPFLRKDGTTFPAEVSSKIFDVGGRKVIQGIVRDMTERKEAEKHVRGYAEKLEASNRLKDLFTDIMSHDLLNPASIVYNVSTILAQKEHPRDAEEVQMIQRNARKILELIRNAATYARVESFDSIDMVDDDLVEIVRAQVESLKPILEEKKMACRCSLPAKAPVRVNPVIALVFENIISNAAKYSPEGSTIEVSIEEGGGEWITAVADEGPGIPDDEKSSVFERFRRREKKGVLGSGLGLAIAQRIVDLHSGTIRIEDNPGGGSRFVVRLGRAQ